MRVGIAYSLAPAPVDRPFDGPDDQFEEFDRPETVEAIAEVIRDEGHEISLLGDGRDFLTRVLNNPPDFVFNIAEGEGVGRCREARVPAALEMLGIPYSGSDPLTLATCLDKVVAKQLVASSCPQGLAFECPVPEAESEERRFIRTVYESFEPHSPGQVLDLTRQSLILKPAFEGSSKGIRNSAVATSEAELIAAYRTLRREYDQPILIEEFIDGDEVTVGVLGNWSLERGTDVKVLGTMRIVPRRATERFVYSLEIKRDWCNQIDYEVPAVIQGGFTQTVQREGESTSASIFVQAESSRVEHAAMMAYAQLGCRDFARIDFRVRNGVPYFIEANPLPGLAPVTSDLVIMAQGYGIGHAELIRRIFHAALARVGLS